MKAFFSKYGYNIFKLFLNQFAIALFGIALAVACGKAQNNTLQWVTSVFAVLFYLFLEYAAMWEIGAKDGISAVARKTSRKLWRGAVIALCANVLNILLAILILPGVIAPGTKAQGFSSVVSVIALMIEGMYTGILAQPFRGLSLNQYAWVYFAIIVPAVLVSAGAYILGSYDLHLTNILIPKNKDVKDNGRRK